MLFNTLYEATTYIKYILFPFLIIYIYINKTFQKIKNTMLKSFLWNIWVIWRSYYKTYVSIYIFIVLRIRNLSTETLNQNFSFSSLKIFFHIFASSFYWLFEILFIYPKCISLIIFIYLQGRLFVVVILQQTIINFLCWKLF